MAHISGINATFANLNIKSGKTVLVFELAQTDAGLLPELSMITGEPVVLDVSTAQQELLLADAETLEETAAYADAPTLPEPMLEMGA